MLRKTSSRPDGFVTETYGQEYISFTIFTGAFHFDNNNNNNNVITRDGTKYLISVAFPPIERRDDQRTMFCIVARVNYESRLRRWGDDDRRANAVRRSQFVHYVQSVSKVWRHARHKGKRFSPRRNVCGYSQTKATVTRTRV